MPKKRLEGNRIEPDPLDPKKPHKVKTKDGKDFSPSKNRIALFQGAPGEWLDADEWPALDATLVCRTPECPAEGEEVESRVGENIDGVFRAACGGCGNEITEMWVDEAVTPLPLDPENAGGK